MLDGPLTDRVDTHKAELHYQYYKKQWEKRQNEIFHKEHQDEEWFKEKYDPFISEIIQNDRLSEIQKISENFLNDYKNNVFENLSLEIDEEKLQEIQSNDNNDEAQEENADNKGNIGVTHQKIYLNDSFSINLPPYFGFDPIENTLFIKLIPKDIGRQEIYQVIKKIPGFQSFSISEPIPNQGFQRYGWITFENEEQFNYAYEKFKKDCLVINKFELNIVKNNQKRMIKVAQKVNLNKSQTDFEYTIKLIKALDQQRGIQNNTILTDKFSFKNLDLNLLYLRRVHSYCYYSGVQCYDERALASKCGCIHLRLKSDSNTEDEKWEQVPNWQNKVQEFAQLKLQEIEQSKDQLKGKALFDSKLASKITYKVQKTMKNETTAWPCFYCHKKFKASDYLVKHIDSKHQNDEKYQFELKKMRLYTSLELYSSDKNKITHQPTLNKDGQYFQNFMNKNKKYNEYNRDKKPYYKKNYQHQFKDLDEPEANQENQQSGNVKNTINYLDI